MLRTTITIFLMAMSIGLTAQELSNSKVSTSAYVSDNTSFLIGDIVLHKDSGVLNSFGVQLFFEMTDNINAVSLSDLIVYPNPTTDKISVISEEKINSIIITDITGQKIKTIKDIQNHQDIDVSDLILGTYLLVFNNKESIKLSITK